jgi:glycosyltransferase involved in cell wall biosynthesis
MGTAAVGLIPNRLKPKSSLYTFPMKLLEYAAAGRAVITSNLPVIKELNLGNWAAAVPAEDPAALATAMKKMNCDQDTRAAARTWARNYTWDKQAESLSSFLRSCADVQLG